MGDERALLIRLGAIGDTLHASAVARLLKGQFPGMEVDFLVSAGVEGLLGLIPEVSRVYALPFRRLSLRIHPAWMRLKRDLNRGAYRLAYLMETDTRFLPLLRGVRADRRVSLSRNEKGNGQDPAGLPVSVRYQRILWDLGLAERQVMHPRLVPGTAGQREALDCLVCLGLNPDAPIVGIHIGNSFRARKKWKRWYRREDTRAWPVERWGQLIRSLYSMQPVVQFVLFGSHQDRAANARVERTVRRVEPGIRLADAAGRLDLAGAAALLSRFSLFVSTDTGPLHMAAALRVPLIGLYGPTRYEQTRPFCEEPALAEVIRKSLPCQPCYGTSAQKACRDNLCMQAIGVEDVVECAGRMKPELFREKTGCCRADGSRPTG